MVQIDAVLEKMKTGNWEFQRQVWLRRNLRVMESINFSRSPVFSILVVVYIGLLDEKYYFGQTLYRFLQLKWSQKRRVRKR